MVHYTGFINLPEHETIEFMVAADDGGTVSIAGQEFGTWNVKGCSWSQSITLSVMPGLYPLDGWFFEAGGGGGGRYAGSAGSGGTGGGGAGGSSGSGTAGTANSGGGGGGGYSGAGAGGSGIIYIRFRV